MDDRDDRFGLVENSQSSSNAMFWRTKLGVLIVSTGICAVVLLTCSSIMISGVSKLSTYEGTLKELEDIIRNQSNSVSPTPSPITGAPSSPTPTSFNPTTWYPTTGTPTKASPTTGTPTKASPTTGTPTEASSATGTPTKVSSTTWNPTKARPTTGDPTTTSSGTSSRPPIATCLAGTENKDKFDCHPEQDGTEERCVDRGCCWEDRAQTAPSYEDPAPVNVPQCFFPAVFDGYKVAEVVNLADGLDISLARQYPSGIPADEASLIVQVRNYDYKTARITIKSAVKDRWIPPIPPIAEQSTERDVGYSVELDDAKRGLSVYRLLDLEKEVTPLFSINLSTLIFANQYIQISSSLPSDEVYGLGDMKGPLKHSVEWTRRILFNKDQPPRYNRSLYGAHALMMTFDKENNANGVYLKNSNAMDVVLQPQPAITFRTLGGILDFFVFIGPKPTDVFAQYQKLVGLPAMVPYWSLGFHLCRYGIWTLNNTRDIYERNVNAKVPLEVQWNDIDYMDNFNMFTYSTQNFSGLPEFVKRVHDDGRKYVMIFDPAVSGAEKPGTYPPYDRGLEMDIFVKNVTNDIVPYKVWNVHTSIFPDFSNPKTDQYWTEMFKDFYHRQEIAFDGAWIDMNEPSNQKNGTLEGGCPATSLDYPPIEIGGERLYTYTACMSDKVFMGNLYDVHNLYPHLEARATYKALTAIRPNKRPFIISRSSSSGQGLWSGHWTGDIDSSWVDMRQSVTDLINYAMFGMPMLGADICGFQYNTTMELCARWQALGAFYPFTRNHNDRLQRDQDPAFLGGEVLNSTIKTLNKKYLFAPYLYTLLHRAHAEGETVFRGMMFNFPRDPKTHDIHDQFMWGEGLLIAPALNPGQDCVKPYLPAGVWYHYNDDGKQILQTAGGRQNFSAPIDDINILMRGGTIIPGQDISGKTLSGNRQNGFILFVAPDEQRSAKGQLFWDDGETLDTYEGGEYSLINFVFSHNTITISAESTGYSAEPTQLKTINILGVESAPSTLWINGKEIIERKMEYTNATKRLVISNLSIEMLDRSSSIVFI